MYGYGKQRRRASRLAYGSQGSRTRLKYRRGGQIALSKFIVKKPLAILRLTSKQQ